MRVLLSTFVLLAIVGVLIFDGVGMYGAGREAVNFSTKAAEQAAQTFVDTKGTKTSCIGSSRTWRPPRASNWLT